MNTLRTRPDVIRRWHAAYKEAIDWLYSDPAALKHFSDYSGLPEPVVAKVRGSCCRRRRWRPTASSGCDQIIAESVALKFLTAPLTPEQIKEVVQIPGVKEVTATSSVSNQVFRAAPTDDERSHFSEARLADLGGTVHRRHRKRC